MKRLLSTIITVAVTAGLKAQLLALKTDALWDGLMTPNLGMEIVTGNKTSFGLSVFGNYKPWGMDMKMVGAIPEFRYWFGGRPMMREFIGVAALGTSYDITWGSETYKGDAWGGGLTFGYAFFLSPHWNIECYGSVGAVYYDHKHYYRDDHYSENRRTATPSSRSNSAFPSPISSSKPTTCISPCIKLISI